MECLCIGMVPFYSVVLFSNTSDLLIKYSRQYVHFYKIMFCSVNYFLSENEWKNIQHTVIHGWNVTE